jgi:diguanylate cyclase (GGDEF)-like protein
MEGLAYLPTTRAHAILASLVALTMLAGLALVWSNVGVPLPHIQPFLPMFGTAVFVTEGVTALLLGMQFAIFRQPFLGALSGAYAFVAAAAAIQLLVFPGVFAPEGLLGAGPQSAVWIWVFWHGGFGFFVLLASVVKRFLDRQTTDRRYSAWFALPLAGIPLGCSLGLCYLAVAHGGAMLPELVANNSYQMLSHSPNAIAVMFINLVALLTVIGMTRGRDVLSLWLSVALLAANCDVFLTLHASARFTLGWYAARCLSMVSSTALLSMLLWEINRLYRNLNEAHAKLTEYSIRDGLTGVYNRRYFDQQFDFEMQRARRSGRPLSVLMCDVDWFKLFNDTFGHQAGDACLIAVAQALGAPVKEAGGFLARYGGEEFVIVLPNTDSDAVTAISERARSAVAALRIAAPPNPAAKADIDSARDVGIVTISIGAATLIAPRDDSRTLLSAADEALYMAKHSGRNRVCFASLEATAKSQAGSATEVPSA